MSSQNQQQLLRRLQAFEAEKQVRYCMNRYMALCDNLDAGFNLDTLMVLFTEDAVWQGAGKRYAKTFGGYRGKAAITDMFSKYTKPPVHFEMNAHFLCNELIDVDIKSGTANGSWMLIQPSTFSSGKSQLSCARITAEFALAGDAWLISSFTTTNIFSRPMVEAWDNPAPLAVPTKAPQSRSKKVATKKKAVTKAASKKKATAQKASPKKVVAKRKATKRKVTRKKVAKKKIASKKISKKAASKKVGSRKKK